MGLAVLPASFLTSLAVSANRTVNAVAGSCFGGLKAFTLSSLIARRVFSSGVWTFFFLGFAFGFAGFLRALVDFAFVLGLDLGFAGVLDFFATGFLVAFAVSAVVAVVAEVVVLGVEAFFLGALVVRPVWAFGLDTALVAYVRYPDDVSTVGLNVEVASWPPKQGCRNDDTRAVLRARERATRLSRHRELG